MNKKVISATAATLLCGLLLNTTTTLAATANNSSVVVNTQQVKQDTLINSIAVSEASDSVVMALNTTDNTAGYLLNSQGSMVGETQGSNELSAKFSELSTMDSYTLREYNLSTGELVNHDVTTEIHNLLKSNQNVNDINSKTTSISGKSLVKNSNVSVYNGTKLLASGTSSATFDFNLLVPRQQWKSVLTIKETTPSGVALSIYKTVEAGVPDSPFVNSIKATDTVVTGKTEPLAIVSVFDEVDSPETILGLAQADINGNFTVKMINSNSLTTRNKVAVQVQYDDNTAYTTVPVNH